MIAGLVQARIIEACPGFAHVGHALTSPAGIDLPAALVTPVRIDAIPNDMAGVHSQMLTVRVGVYVLLGRRQDAQSSALDELGTLQAELQAALVGWHPGAPWGVTEPFLEPFQYAGGALDRFQEGVSCWRDDFTTRRAVRVYPA